METTAPHPDARPIPMETNLLSVEVEDGVAVVWMDDADSRVNTISPAMLDAIGEAFDVIQHESAAQAAVFISGKEDTFIAGADLKVLQQFDRPEAAEALSRTSHRLLERVERIGKPVVAAIHGPAMGGGLELALACTYRIATHHPKTKLALPEVQLGLLPGGGGTQNLPRLVGLQQAFEMMLTGKTVYPKKAKRIGLVDALIHKPGLLHAATTAARQLADGSLDVDRDPLSLTDRLLESNTLSRRYIYQQAEKNVQKKTRGNYPAPFKIIECVRAGLEDGRERGLEMEARYFGELAFTPESKALVSLFFAKQGAEKNPLQDQARAVRTVGVLGAAGLMGAGIAQVSAENGYNVLLKDQDFAHAAQGRKHIWERLSRKAGKGILSDFERDQILERARPVAGYDAFAEADLVIEAVPESLDLKHRVLRDVENAAPEECIFASNTSSIPIADLASASARPENVLGMHYFSPVPSIPLLEIIATEDTSDEALATAYAVGLRQGKTPIVVQDGPGFYTTRILALYMNEALLLLEEGADAEQIDAVMMDFGFPMGPFELFDLVGIDVAAKITEVMSRYFEKGSFAGRAFQTSGSAATLAQAGYLGQKSGTGFYHYEEDDKGRDQKKGFNEDIYGFFGGASRTKRAPAAIQERLALTMMGEAIHCLQDGILRSPTDGDLGAVFGLGFPPFRGGPFRYADRETPQALLTRFERLQKAHGERFRPPQLLREKAESGERFHDG